MLNIVIISLVWKVDGEVNWSDNCDFWGQDLTYIKNTKKEACGQLCLANSKCAHFTWDVTDSGKCWLKNWIGDSPSVQDDGRRCGFIPGRVIDVNALKATVTDLSTVISQLQTKLNGI